MSQLQPSPWWDPDTHFLLHNTQDCWCFYFVIIWERFNQYPLTLTLKTVWSLALDPLQTSKCTHVKTIDFGLHLFWKLLSLPFSVWASVLIACVAWCASYLPSCLLTQFKNDLPFLKLGWSWNSEVTWGTDSRLATPRGVEENQRRQTLDCCGCLKTRGFGESDWFLRINFPLKWWCIFALLG